MSELLWIAVPGGAVAPGGGAPLAVAIVPRLAGGGATLADHGMDRWPELVHGTTFTLEIRRPGATDAVPIQPAFRHPLDEMLANWQAIFVTPRGADEPPPRVELPSREEPAQREIEVLSTTAEATGLRGLYAKDLADEDWTAELGRVAAAGAPRGARRARRSGGRSAGPRRDRTPPDFHWVVALLREHPHVLRALGLIVDFEATLPADVEAIRIAPTLPPWPAGPQPQPSRPWTRCGLERSRFLAEPGAASGLGRGVVRLGGAGPLESSDNPRWAVVTFDVDAAMARIPDTDEAEPALAGLRSAGLGLLQPGRGQELQSRIGRPEKSGSADGVDLFAEDLVLGYRIDVRDEGAGEWRSLCERRAEYTIAGRPLGPPPGGLVEEGHVKRDAMVAHAAEGPLEGDELLVRWDGWSLAVPRPVPGGRRAARGPTALDWRLSVAPPLPQLRFDRDYRLRARVADLAGGGLTVADLAQDGATAEATEPVFYGRVEPIPAPLPAVMGEHGPGAALERLVVRSAGGLDEETGAVPELDRRLLLAPPVSVELADQHGVFDVEDVDASWELARRAMPSVGPEEPDTPPVAGRPVGWLPDPLARDWVVRVRNAGERWTASGRWETTPGSRPLEYAPLVLELVGGSAVGVSHANGVVTVSLPPGQRIELDVSSAPARDDVSQIALHRWLPGEAFDSARSDIMAGRQRHITPPRTLHLVHAVQRPMGPSPQGFLRIERAAGETFATLTAHGGLGVSRATAGRVEIRAAWQDWDDDGPGAVVSVDLESDAVTPGAGAWPLEPKRHELGDTRRRRVTYSLTAVSRFQEYFDAGLRERDPKAFTTAGAPVVLEVPSSARPAEPVVLYTTPATSAAGAAPEPGWQEWQRLRRGGLLRVHMAPRWYSSGEGEQLAVVVSPDEFPARKLRPFLSEAGRDPVMPTGQPRHWVGPADVAGPPGGAVSAHLEELGSPVYVVPSDPWRDPDGSGAWFADIDLGPLGRTSYRPFVQLALARYQPLSLDGLHLSPVVRAEMIQLLPDRELSVRRSGGQLLAVLRGVGPSGELTRVDAWIERWSGPPGQPPGPPTTEFTRLDVPEPGSEFPSWLRVPELAVQGVPFEELRLADPAGSTEPHRLVIRETETLPQSGGQTGDLARRVVFAETVLL